MTARDVFLPDSETGVTATFLEVPCEYGVIDVVHTRFDLDELDRREELGLVAVPERRLLSTLRLLNAEGGSAATSRLAGLGMVSQARMRNVVGPELASRGWITVDHDRWRLRAPVTSPAVDVVAVEIKQTDSSRGLAQAGRYAAAAERVVLALGPDGLAERTAARTAGSGIGVAQVGHDGTVTSWQVPLPQPDLDPLARACLAEQLARMREMGAHSGPVREVFGRLLVSAGADPRF